MQIREKTLVTLKVSGQCPSHSRTDIKARDVTAIIDEPEARGGTNAGPSPTEMMIAALIGCTNVITHKCAHAHGVDIKAMSIDVDAQFDRRGVTLQEELEVPFPEMTLKIDLTSDADEDAIEKVKTDLAKYCPVSKVIRASGTVISEQWTVNR